MKKLFWTILTLICWYFINACEGTTSYPNTPEIEFNSFKISNERDTLGNIVKNADITFKFVDGDGDLFTPDTSFRSLFLSLYKFGPDSFVKVPDSTLYPPPSFHLPYSSVMDRNGQNKTQKGTLEFSYPFYFYNSNDSIKLEFYITDMAGNKSNVIKTPGFRIR